MALPWGGGMAPDDRGRSCTGIQFSAEPLQLPWYRVADAITRDGQRNAEEVADRIKTSMDNLNATAPPDKRETPPQAKERERRVRRNSGQLLSLLREEKHFWISGTRWRRK